MLRTWICSGIANLSLLAGTFLVLVLLLEIGVRLFDPQPAVRYRFSPHSFYEPIPGARFVYRRREFAVPIRYNGFGMRDRERSLAKPAGGVRVALVGDSQTESKEVPFDSTWGQLLERRLQERWPSRRPEVLNFGVSGYGTVATTIRFRTLGARFRPDVVLYLFVDNDPYDNVGKDRQLYVERDGRMEFRPLASGGRIPLRRRGIDFLKQHLQAYSFLKFRVAELGARSDAAPERGDAAPRGAAGPGEEAWRSTALALERLRDSVAESGGRLLVVQGVTSGEAMSERLERMCADLGVPYHDLLPALRRARGPLHYTYDGHWRASGHAVAAADLAPFLEAYLPAPDSGRAGSP